MMTDERDHRDDELLAIRCQMGETAGFDDLIARLVAKVFSPKLGR